MNIVNIIHIGDKEYRHEELSKDKRKEMGLCLTVQSLGKVGYKLNKASA